MSQSAVQGVDYDELAVLRWLALEGALDGEVKISCAEVATALDVSTQTASRRLQHLEQTGLVIREQVGDGQWVDITEDGRRALREEYETYRTIFEGLATVELVGTITAGMGEGRHYITLDGYMEQFRDRIGYEPYPGTLNVSLTEESLRRRSAIDTLDPIPIDGWESEDRTYGPAVCYPATVTTDQGTYEEAHIISPERTHHSDEQIELIAPDRLRDQLALDDDDHVRITIYED